MARVSLPESKIRGRRRRRRLITVAVAAVLFIAIAAGLLWLAHASFLRISQIDVAGTETVASSTIRDTVREQLTGDYLYFLPKNNILLYPKGPIHSALLEAFPALASISIQAENFHTISVTVSERQPKALWCGDTVATSSPCFLLDESGVAYGASLNFSGNVYTKYFGMLMGSSTPKRFLRAAQFRSLSALVDTIAATQAKESLRSVWVDGNNDVHLSFVSGVTLLFTVDADAGDVYQRFTLALQSDPFKTHKLSDFEYLDLRFGDKLYYKLK